MRRSTSPTSPRSSCAAIKPTGESTQQSRNWLDRIRALPAVRRWPALGAWSFPIEPDASAEFEPAVWLASEAPSIVFMSPAPGGYTGVRLDELSQGRTILVDIKAGTDRHLVMTGEDGRHRLLVRGAGPGDELAFTLIPDRALDLRAAAATRLARLPLAESTTIGRRRDRPSRFQIHRLTLLLRVADHLAAAESGMSTRDIAITTAYPWLVPGRSIEWKSSAERRQTQRLLREARSLVEGGYRNLLSGSLRSRTFTSK